MALLFFQKTIFTPLYGLNSTVRHFVKELEGKAGRSFRSAGI